MTYRHYLTAGTLMAAIALSGCTVAAGGGGAVTPDDCGAAALADRIGQPVTGTTATDLRIGGEPVASRGAVRVLGPGQPMTMDFRADRLTIETDAAGNLVKAQCV